jgi:RNA polymerase sigma factor (sigma-70 family)
MEESQFIQRLMAGDEQAYTYLCDHYAGMLFGIITRIVPDVSHAENLLQDSYIKIWKNISKYEPSKGTLATWMINIARNTAIDFTRSKYYSQLVKNQNIENSVHYKIESNEMEISTDNIGMREMINSLPPHYQEIIDCMYFRGYTQQEISEEFDVPLGTVKTRTRQAMAELRKFFSVEIK